MMKLVPRPHLAPDLERPAQRPHPGDRHVHADTPTGDSAHRRGGAEAGPRQHPKEHVVVGRIHAGLDQPFALRLGQYGPAVDAPAVIADPKRDAVSIPGRREEDPALRRLPGRDPLVGQLDPMIGRIPDEVKKRFADLVQDRAIQLDVLALHVEPDPLAEIPGEVPDQAGEPVEYFTHRCHPSRDHLALHRGHETGDPVAHFPECGVGAADSQHAEPVLGDHELAHLLHQDVQP